MAGHKELTKDVDIDIAGLFSNIWKKKWLIAIISLLSGLAIFLIMSSISPRYQTTAQLIIEPRESQFTRVNRNAGNSASEFDAAAVLSQVQILLSDDIALSTIKKLELASKPEFRNESEPSLLSDLFIVIGLKSNPLQISPDERVLKAFKKRLKAYPIEQSRVIEILYWANDRALAKQITNTIADEFLKLQRQSKLETDADATKFLEPEIVALRDKVRAAESKVAQFRSNSDILIGNNNALLATQQLSETSTELSRVRAQRSAAQAKVESVRSNLNTGASLEAIPEVVASPLIQRLRERQVQLRAQISELSTTLLGGHPRLKALKSQVRDFENQIRREARGILTSLENNVVIAQKQEKSLVQELSRLKTEAARAGEAEVEMRALEREAVSERELLQAYMAKFREAAGRQSSKYLPINARIISSAHLPTDSYYPKTIPYTIAGMIVSAILTMVAILTMSLLSGSAFKTVNEDDDLLEDHIQNQDHTALNDLHEVPSKITPPPMDMSEINDEDYALPISTQPLRTDMAESSTDGSGISIALATEAILGMGQQRIAVVSPSGDEGSIGTWCLARNLAAAGKTVALMDMTGSGITTEHMLGSTSAKGVSDVLAGAAEFDQIIYSDRQSSVAILPVGRGGIAGDPRIASERLAVMVEALSNGYDYLIIDCGMVDIDGVSHIADADTVILVCTLAGNANASFEQELIENGYEETISVSPSNDEVIATTNVAA